MSKVSVINEIVSITKLWKRPIFVPANWH